MQSLSCFPSIGYLFLALGIAFSIFYALNAVWIFVHPIRTSPIPSYQKSWWVHQIWINFLGQVLGWGALYFLLREFEGPETLSAGKISWEHVFLFIVGIMGVMGFLPNAFWNISRVPAKIIDKL